MIYDVASPSSSFLSTSSSFVHHFLPARGRRPGPVPRPPPGSVGSEKEAQEAADWSESVQGHRHQNQGHGVSDEQGPGAEHPE